MKKKFALCSAAAFIGVGAFSLAPGMPPQAHALTVTVQAEPVAAYTEAVTDFTNRISADEQVAITQAAADYHDATGGNFHLVLVNDLAGLTPERYSADVLAQTQNGPHDIVLVIGPNSFGFTGGSAFSDADLDAFWEAAVGPMNNKEFGQAALALLARAGAPTLGTETSASSTSKTSAAPTASSSGGAVLAGGVGALALAGGGLFLYSRKSKRKHTAAVLQAADPQNVQSLAALPLPALVNLAEEELVSTDDSIQNAKEELDRATAEFGAERTRQFNTAMNHSITTLQKAFQLKAQLDARTVAGEAAQRAMLLEIIQSCAAADDALDAQAQDFAQMHSLVLNAADKLDTITQQLVDLHTRIPAAQRQLATLEQRYPASTLAAIALNVELAEATLQQAHAHADAGRELLSKPAGEQGGMVDAIRLAEQAIAKADTMLASVEHAEADIATAVANIPDLHAEVRAEIEHAIRLREKGQQLGTKMDWNAVDATIATARTNLEQATQQQANEPLRAWSLLTNTDSQLDAMIEQLEEGTTNHERLLQVFTQQQDVATTHIRAAREFISSRGRVVKASARTLLAEAEQLLAKATVARVDHTRDAIEFARLAALKATEALQAAQHDDQRYQRKHHSSGSNMGGMIAGMVLQEVLRSQRRGGGFGGFGGVGGGGSRGGGSRGGSFGGGSRGGSF
ncbi:TPM domain-containing protein [Corynebacterium sp. HS2168-gen11]|uniref:TPM domain-containing protein n=1 Tax=Corynebacterium sp. HS2168-gen11 TaxID=2974027 RepID=UPI00216B1941|nr:TPM domain-containing protein [Corynebacterium sp. HS2168-gen11]MCS4535410.1 TPM domain-containing protein [Corynebacterium sp. HS2168-gen11]